MKQLHRLTPVLLVLSIILWSAFPAVAAVPQAGPRSSRRTQLGQDPGRPMFVACVGSQPCQFLGMVDPSGIAIGEVIIDSGYYTTCGGGECFVPAPFAITPAFLAGTAVAATAGGIGGMSAGTIGAIAGTATAAVVGGAVGGTVGTSGNPVQSGSK